MTAETTPTHIALAKKHYGPKQRQFVWLEIGKGRLDKNGNFHAMLDRLPIGGFNGYACFVPIGQQPPEIEPARPNEDSEAEA
jgi:hypothetical protein